MEIGAFLQKLCVMLQDIFYMSYGDRVDSKAGDLLVTDTGAWIQLLTASNPSILRLRNLDPANEVMITWNDKDVIGGKISADSTEIYDNVTGVVYIKPVAAGTSATINYLLISRKIND